LRFSFLNGIKIFPLTDISVSVPVNVNHTGLQWGIELDHYIGQI